MTPSFPIFCVGLGTCIASATASVTFTRIVDATFQIAPGTTHQYGILRETYPSLHAGRVAFVDDYFGETHVYQSIGGVQSFVAGPGVDTISIGDELVIRENYGGVPGLYSHDGPAVRTIVNANTPVPGGTGNFQVFAFQQTRRDSTTFLGSNAPLVGRAPGIYRSRGSSVTVVADRNTQAVNGATFTGFQNQVFDGDNVWFTGYYGSSQGAFLSHDGVVTPYLQRGDVLPNGQVLMGVGGAAYDHGQYAYGTITGGANFGIWANMDGTLRLVADGTTRLPNGASLTANYTVSINNGVLVFSDYLAGGIWTWSPQAGITQIITLGDRLDGRVASRLFFNQNAHDGNTIAFFVDFGNFTQGSIYTATFAIPAPGVALVVGGVVLMGAARRRRSAR